jgi:hypothetical protein
MSTYSRTGIAVITGIAIAEIDNYTFSGEASPIVIVVLLLLATGTVGFLWGKRGWLAAALIWVCIPGAHLLNHVLGLPDTIQPNTYASIVKLAAFTFVIAAIGTACGVAFFRHPPSG